MGNITLREHPLLRKMDTDILTDVYLNHSSPYDLRCPYIDPLFVREHSAYAELSEKCRAHFRFPFIFKLEGLEDRKDVIVLSTYKMDIQLPCPGEDGECSTTTLTDMCVLYIHDGYTFVDYVDVALYLARCNFITPEVYLNSPDLLQKDLKKTHPEEFPDLIPGKWYYENVVQKYGKGDALWLYWVTMDISLHKYFQQRYTLA